MTDAVWFLYLLRCAGDRIYTGISTDPARRLRDHAAGRGARFTRAFPPQELLAVRPCGTAREARQHEHHIKQLDPAGKRALALSWRETYPAHQPDD